MANPAKLKSDGRTNAEYAAAAAARMPTDVKDAEAARDASVLDGVTRDTADKPAPRRRSRKRPVTAADKDLQEAMKPARTRKSTPRDPVEAKADARARHTKPAPEPEPEPKPESARDHNQQIARDLIDCVAARFSGASAADQVKIANWLKVLPTGGAGHERYWPESFARPTTSDWRVPE